jgi:hypothetical protein
MPVPVVPPVDNMPTAMSVVPPAAVKPPPQAVMPPKAVKRKVDDGDRPVTPEELQEANEYLRLAVNLRPGKDVDTVRGVSELRKDILEGRFGATQQRKKELGLSSDVHVSIPSKDIKIKTKYRKKQFEKYLETARRLDAQKKERLAQAVDDVMKGADQ